MSIKETFTRTFLGGPIYAWVLFACFLVFSYYYHANRRQNLRENKVETVGEIVDYYNFGRYRILFSDGKKSYELSYRAGIDLKGCIRSFHCNGRRFFVYYEKGNPYNFRVDFNREIEE